MHGIRMAAVAVSLLMLAGLRPAQAFTQPEQVAKLEAFRDAMVKVGPRWASALESWKCPTPANNSDSECDPCGRGWWGNWEHMACRSTKTDYRHDTIPGDGIITHLHFSLTGVEGPPFHEICDIGQHLKEWDFKVCNLDGPMPPWASSCLPAMEEYDLSRNHITGTIPADVGNQTRMNQFKFQGNKLTGPLPPELGTLPRLEWLRVFDNQLSGPIPDNYRNLAPHLTQVSIGGNGFTGPLYAFADTQLQNVNVTFLPSMCGMVPVGLAYAAGYDLVGSPGLGLPCPDELAKGWPDVADDF